MPTEIQTGLIGFGFGGRIFHAPFVRATPGLRLTTIVQRSKNTAAAEYPESTGVRVLRSIEELLADDRIELIVVCTPNGSHYEVAKQCLLAGRHVVVDKPLAVTAAQAQDLVETARTKGRHLFVFHNRRWDGDFLTVKQVLDSGELGRLVTFEGRWDRFRPIPRQNTWKETADEGTGMLLDLGPHMVDQALALFGRPESVTGEITTDRDNSVVDDAFQITLHYAKTGSHHGLRAQLSASMVAADAAPRFLLHGTHGSFRKYGLDAQEAALLGGARPPLPDAANPPFWLANPETEWGTITSAKNVHEPIQLSTRRIPTLPGDYRNYYAAVRDALLGKPNHAVTGQEGVRALRILELARESSAVGRTLPVPESGW
ncbi:MAG: Gfo/Idh/MocA family oxidoreductase [Acidobacteriaceae bacterium]|nr:Gfo/Idh/MocA family oxidoreductase [Acidobacteriaceae bacterium]